MYLALAPNSGATITRLEKSASTYDYKIAYEAHLHKNGIISMKASGLPVAVMLTFAL